MGLGDALKGLIQAKFKTLQLFSNNKSVIIKELHIHNGDNITYDESTGKVSLGMVNLTREEKTLVMLELPNQLERYNTPLLETELSDGVCEYKQAVSKMENKTKIEYAYTELKESLAEYDVTVEKFNNIIAIKMGRKNIAIKP